MRARLLEAVTHASAPPQAPQKVSQIAFFTAISVSYQPDLRGFTQWVRSQELAMPISSQRVTFSITSHRI